MSVLSSQKLARILDTASSTVFTMHHVWFGLVFFDAAMAFLTAKESVFVSIKR